MDKKDCKISLIIATYNWEEALELSLLSLVNQKEMPFEVIIADDGSRNETKELIDKYRAKIKVPLYHVWHKDEGFRLAEIRNKAIAKSNGDYIVQIDGDIIMHQYFIKDHRMFAEKKAFVRASRIYLNETFSQELMLNKSISINLLTKGVSNKTSALRIPFLWKMFAENYKIKGDELWEIHGCNMAFWKEDAIKVNGYNESFFGWGPEDKEFVARLLNSGCKKRFLKLGGIAYHIHHAINEKEFLKKNEAVFAKTKKEKIAYCSQGISKYL